MSAITVSGTTFDGFPIVTMPDGSSFYHKDGKMYKYDQEAEKKRLEAEQKKKKIEAVKEIYLGDLSSIDITFKNDKGQPVQTMVKKAVCLISNDRALGVFEYHKGKSEEVFKAIHTFYISEHGWRRNSKGAGLSNLDTKDVEALIALQMKIGWV